MEDGTPMFRRTRRARPLKIIIAVLVALIVILSGVSIFYYLQAKDYHDAKYRAQWVLMKDIWESVYVADFSIKEMIDSANNTITSRAMSGYLVQDSLGSLLNSVWAVREMYLNDAEKNESFSLFKQAVEAVMDNAEIVYIGLWLNSTLDRPYVENATLNAQLFTASSLLGNLRPVIYAGFAVDPYGDYSNSWEHSPYSVVDRVDLGKVRSTSAQIIALF